MWSVFGDLIFFYDVKLTILQARDEIGASPMEIARAYMNSRASEVGPSSKSIAQTIESTVLHSDEAVLKPYDPSPSKKSSTGWPGAVVQNTYGTPQSQGSRYGLHNHPRTPYSRTLLTKSRSKVCFLDYFDGSGCVQTSDSFSFSLVDQSQSDFFNSPPSITDNSVSAGITRNSDVVIVFNLWDVESYNNL